MNPVFATIAGVGSAVPSKILTNDELSKKVDTTDEWIRTRTGILERRIAGENEATSDFAYLAAKAALQMAHVNASDINVIFVATCTPDTLFPSTACRIQDRLGAENASAMDLSAACTGFNYALEIAGSYIEAGKAETVLVVGADTLSKFVDWTDRSTCVLFGDGAGAAVLRRSSAPGLLGSYLRARGAGGPLLCIPGGGTRSPMKPGESGSVKPFIYMDGKEVFKFAVEVMVESVRKVLEKCHVSLDEVAMVIPHQANIRIIDMAVKRLSLKRERVYVNLQKYGNTSAASIPLALDEAVRNGKIRKDDLVLLTGFGAGLTYGANLLRWTIS